MLSAFGQRKREYRRQTQGRSRWEDRVLRAGCLLCPLLTETIFALASAS